MENETMEQLKKRLNSSSKYLQSNDMRVIDVHEGYAKVEMIIDEQILNGHGFVHGGALFSLGDTAAGAASFATGRDSVTLSASINYIKPGIGGKLIAIAQEISPCVMKSIFTYSKPQRRKSSDVFFICASIAGWPTAS